METPHWFEEEWLSTNAKAIGVYKALLYFIFETIPGSRQDKKRMVKEEMPKGPINKDAFEAWKSAEAFIDALYANETFKDEHGYVKWKDETKERLEAIEGEHYEKFRKACYKYYASEEIEELSELERKYLRNTLEGLRHKPTKCTPTGSVYGIIHESNVYGFATGKNYYSLEEEKRREEGERAKRIIMAMERSGILWFGGIVPAPFLERGFIKELAPPAGAEAALVKTVKVEGEVREVGFIYEGRRPSREILEEIVRDVLESMGFTVGSNVHLPTRGSGTLEVDVWGWKGVGIIKFYAYASCKNWDKDVDRSEIDREFGRVQQLNQIPHIKIFVAKGLTDSARKVALADGFIVIELKEKATTDNAGEIFEIIYKQLREIFTGIAPPELQKVAKEAESIAEKLKSLAETIKKLAE